MIGCASDDLTLRFDVKSVTHNETGVEFYQVLLLIGHFFVATIYPLNPELTIQTGLGVDTYVPIWPPAVPVVWPPPVHIDTSELFRRLS